jgi:ribosomal protein L12E/L44/L45/RPP1/RPP2
VKIECILKRAGGTKVTLGGTRYHFLADDQDRHVAEVENEAHQRVFLNIPEGYRSLEAVPVPVVTQEEALATLAAAYPGVDVAALLASAAAAPAAPEATAPEATAPEATAADAAQTGTKGGDAANADGANELNALSDDELRALFEKEVGRKPNAKATADTLIAQILAARDEAGKQ